MTGTLAQPPIPQLEAVRNTSFMRDAFDRAITDVQIRDCSVMNIRNKPGKSCLVSYRLLVSRNEMDMPASMIVAARFYTPGSSMSRYVKARRLARATPVFGEAVFHIPDLHAVVWAFPNDRKLPGIPALTDEPRIAREVTPRLVAGGGRTSLEVVRYIAEHGCTARLTVHPPGGGPERIFYGKTYSDDKGGRTWHNMNALWASDARKCGALRMAQPAAYEPQHLTLWQSEVAGPTLASLEASGPRFVPHLQAAGRAVAALHCTPLPGLRHLITADDCTALQEAELCLRQLPPLSGRVTRLTAKLVEQTRERQDRPVATLHGDLHAKNVLFTGDSAALIDLDNLRAGDPVRDLGSFVASTCARSLAREIAVSDIASMISALVRAYEDSVPWDVPRAALRWFTAASLVAEQAHRAIIRVKVANLDALLELAEQALAGAGVMKVMS